MPVPTTIDQLSTTAASNYPQGTDSPSTLDDVQRAHGAFIRQLQTGAVATTANITSGTIAGVTSVQTVDLTATGSSTLGDAAATDVHSINGRTTLVANSANPALTVTQSGAGVGLSVAGSVSATDNVTTATNKKFSIGSDRGYLYGDASAGEVGTNTTALNVVASGSGAVVNTKVGGAGTTITTVSSTGLAVTGALSATGAGQGALTLAKSGTPGISVYSDAAGVLKVYDNTGGVDRVTLDASGNFLHATSAPVSATQTGIQLAAGDKTLRICATTGTTNTTVAYFYNGNGIVGSITTSGSATAYNVSSDARLKENISEADSSSALVDSLQVRQFDWKADGQHQRYGFIAQELLQVVPEAVSVPEDTEQMMAVDYSKLVPLLVKEVQSLRARLAALEAA